MITVKDCGDLQAQAFFCKDTIFSCMQELRAVVDEAETVTAKAYWPFPNYAELLFSV